jgi:hypothetical protein
MLALAPNARLPVLAQFLDAHGKETTSASPLRRKRSPKGRVQVSIDESFPVNGKAYRELSTQEWSEVRSITVERHFVLNWLCGYAPENEVGQNTNGHVRGWPTIADAARVGQGIADEGGVDGHLPSRRFICSTR